MRRSPARPRVMPRHPDLAPERRPVWRRTALAALAALLLLAGLGAAVALSPGLAERLLWRVEAWQARPTLSQRIYERRLLAHQLAQDARLPAGALLVFGDSHLQALPLGHWPGAHNFAIGGESAERLAARLPRFTSLARARAVVLGSGSNDLLEGRTPQAAAQAWRAVLDAVPPGPAVLCLEIPLNPQRPAQAAAQRAFNALLAEQCRQRRHPVLPGALFEGGDGFTADGLHLNPAGSARWLDHIHRALENLP